MQSMHDDRNVSTGGGGISDFLLSDVGRIIKVSIGAGLIGIGMGRGGRTGGIISAVGLEPLVSGLFNFSLLSFLPSGGRYRGEVPVGDIPRVRTQDVTSHTEANVGVESGNVETSIGT